MNGVRRHSCVTCGVPAQPLVSAVPGRSARAAGARTRRRVDHVWRSRRCDRQFGASCWPAHYPLPGGRLSARLPRTRRKWPGLRRLSVGGPRRQARSGRGANGGRRRVHRRAGRSRRSPRPRHAARANVAACGSRAMHVTPRPGRAAAPPPTAGAQRRRSTRGCVERPLPGRPLRLRRGGRWRAGRS